MRTCIRPVLLTGAVLMLLAAAPGTPLPVAAGETSGSSPGAASDPSPAVDFTWISRLYDDIRTLAGVDDIPQGGLPEEIRHAWDGGIESLPPELTICADSTAEKIFGAQIDYITAMLERRSSLRDDAEGSYSHLDEVAGAVKQLSNVSPIVQAAGDSIRSSLLVISSVGCACEMERCSTMVDLFGVIQADPLGGPIAMVDLMQAPVLEDVLGPVTIPYWILFDEKGRISTLIEGASDAPDVRASVASWLGLPAGIPGRFTNPPGTSNPAPNYRSGP
jgi:hypothetical protein